MACRAGSETVHVRAVEVFGRAMANTALWSCCKVARAAGAGDDGGSNERGIPRPDCIHRTRSIAHMQRLQLRTKILSVFPSATANARPKLYRRLMLSLTTMVNDSSNAATSSMTLRRQLENHSRMLGVSR